MPTLHLIFIHEPRLSGALPKQITIVQITIIHNPPQVALFYSARLGSTLCWAV